MNLNRPPKKKSPPKTRSRAPFASRMIKMTKRTMRAAKSGQFFAVNEWYFHAENMKELIRCINNSVADGRTPPYKVDITSLDWESYVNQYVLGIRKYVLKDSPDTLGKARSKLFKWVLNKNYWNTQGLWWVEVWRAVDFLGSVIKLSKAVDWRERNFWKFSFTLVLQWKTFA